LGGLLTTAIDTGEPRYILGSGAVTVAQQPSDCPRHRPLPALVAVLRGITEIEAVGRSGLSTNRPSYSSHTKRITALGATLNLAGPFTSSLAGGRRTSQEIDKLACMLYSLVKGIFHSQ
jgi:hypothetical protein